MLCSGQPRGKKKGEGLIPNEIRMAEGRRKGGKEGVKPGCRISFRMLFLTVLMSLATRRKHRRYLLLILPRKGGKGGRGAENIHPPQSCSYRRKKCWYLVEKREGKKGSSIIMRGSFRCTGKGRTIEDRSQLSSVLGLGSGEKEAGARMESLFPSRRFLERERGRL